MQNGEESLREISNRLNLVYESQDWGIINAMPRRLMEFINFYESKSLNEVQKYHMFELIFASANEGLMDNSLNGFEIGKFKNFLSIHGKEVPLQLEYWSKLPCSEEFPVVNLLLNSI